MKVNFDTQSSGGVYCIFGTAPCTRNCDTKCGHSDSVVVHSCDVATYSHADGRSYDDHGGVMSNEYS